MRPETVHRWDLTTAEARDLQLELAPRVVEEDGVPDPPRLVAGVDISKPDMNGETLGAVVVLRYPGMEVAEVRTARKRPPMPYVPGLLSFRETPVLLAAFEQITMEPDVIMVDGHGRAHPRRFGIACHLGMLLDVPAIGCAKSVLVGSHGALAEQAGSASSLLHKGEVIGMGLRTQTGRTPIYVSVGHKVDLPSAMRWTMACAGKYRVPEPTRLAHIAASGRPLRAPNWSTTGR